MAIRKPVLLFSSLLLLANLLAGAAAGGVRKTVGIYELKRGGFSVKVTNWGARVISVIVPDSEGKLDDITLGYDKIAPYINDTEYFGSLLGRVANRISNAQFTLNGKTYHLFRNDGNNSIQGGHRGFGKVIWTVREKVDGEFPYITLYYRSFDGEQGFPGDVDVFVTYKIDYDYTLSVAMHAMPLTKPTPINLGLHIYWNLAGQGSGDVLDHSLQLFASHYTPADAHLIPTGAIVSARDTPFDFLHPMPIGSRIAQLTGGGYDINYVLSGTVNDRGLRKAAAVESATSGRVMEIWTNQPGMQFYTGNHLKDVRGKRGHIYQAHAGFALETQGFPDAVNHPNFPSQIYLPGQVYKNYISYRFTFT